MSKSGLSRRPHRPVFPDARGAGWPARLSGGAGAY